MDLKAVETAVESWVLGGPAVPVETVVGLLERVQELETEKDRGREFAANLERRLDEAILGKRKRVEMMEGLRPSDARINRERYELQQLENIKDPTKLVVGRQNGF